MAGEIISVGGDGQGSFLVDTDGTVTAKDASGTETFSVDASGNMTAAGTATLTGDATASGDLTVTGDLTVSGYPQGTPIWKTATVAFDDTSPKTLFSVPAGKIWIVDAIFTIEGTAWDGTGFEIDIGVSGDDTDGYIDGSAVNNDGSADGVDASDRGALLWSGTAPLLSPLPAESDIIATITPGSGATEGDSTVYIRIVEL